MTFFNLAIHVCVPSEYIFSMNYMPCMSIEHRMDIADIDVR